MGFIQLPIVSPYQRRFVRSDQIDEIIVNANGGNFDTTLNGVFGSIVVFTGTQADAEDYADRAAIALGLDWSFA